MPRPAPTRAHDTACDTRHSTWVDDAGRVGPGDDAFRWVDGLGMRHVDDLPTAAELAADEGDGR